MMKYLLEWILDERIILIFSALIFALLAMVLIHWNADKEYVMTFTGFSTGLIGALLRGLINTPKTPEEKP